MYLMGVWTGSCIDTTHTLTVDVETYYRLQVGSDKYFPATSGLVLCVKQDAIWPGRSALNGNEMK